MGNIFSKIFRKISLSQIHAMAPNLLQTSVYTFQTNRKGTNFAEKQFFFLDGILHDLLQNNSVHSTAALIFDLEYLTSEQIS